MNALNALIIKDFMTAYGKTPMAVLWAILEPVIGIVLLTSVFSQISHVPPIGSSYPLFYATGYLPFLLFTSIQGRMMSSVRQSKYVLAHSSVSVFDVLASRLIMQSLVMGMVMMIVYVGLWVIYPLPERPDAPLFMLAFLIGVLSASGFGVMNCGIITIFPQWEKVWAVASRPLFLISGVFYPFYAMPPALQNYLWWNPILHIVGMNREAVYQGYQGHYISLTYVLLVALITWVIGFSLILLKKA